jgi:hypothetical protein
LSGYDVCVTDEEARLTISELVKEARDRFGEDRKSSAERIGTAYNTLSDVEREGRLPAKATQGAIERGFGLRDGCLKALWDQRRTLDFGKVDLEMLLDPHARPPRPPEGKMSFLPLAPASRAADLSDQELMAELSFRFLMRDSRMSKFGE